MLIGGVAGVLLGSTRLTMDIDVLVDCGQDNLSSLLAALQEMDAMLLMEVEPGRVEGVGVPSLPMLRSLARHNWTTRFGDLDTHCSVAGFESYAEVAARAWYAVIGDASVKVVPLTVLIEMKEASGRTKDELALVELYKLRAMGVERGDGPR